MTTESQTYSGERGRDATRPADIPFPGWKDIGARVFAEITNDRVLLIAAGVTFYLLLALGPMLAALVSLYGLAFDPADITEQINGLSGVLPGGAVDILSDQLERLTGAESSTLGIAFASSLLIALWSTNSGMKALFQAMNVAYNEKEDRGFLRLTLTTLCFTLATLFSIIALIVAKTVLTVFPEAIGISLPNWLVNSAVALLALFGLILFMACLFRYGPSRDNPKWRWITPGAVFAGISIVVVSIAFSFYVANFGSYNETYGSLGAVIGFLTWLWITMIVLVVSGELNAEMEHQTARDTTKGPSEPMGERGAKVADKVGEPIDA